MATIKDVAKLAGVSISTVSLAMNYPERVSQATKAKIFHAMRELRYVPTTASKNLCLMREKKKSVVLISSEVSGPYFYELMRGISETLLISGLEMILLCGVDAEKRHFTEMARNPFVCGIILLEINDLAQCDIPDALARNVPVVLVNTKSDLPGVGSVSIDNYYIGEMVANHFLHIGYRDIALMGDRSKERALRAEGFIDTLKSNGIHIPPHWHIPAYLDEKSGYAEMERFLASGAPLPQAMFCINDEIALGAIDALRLKDIAVPQQIAVIGCDDVSVSKFTNPPLTTVTMPKFEMGMLSVTQLLWQLNGKQAENIVLNAKLTTRQSCGYKLRQSKRAAQANASHHND